MVFQGGCARMAPWFEGMRGRRRGWSEVAAEAGGKENGGGG